MEKTKKMNVTSSNVPAFRRAEALKKAKKERIVQDLVVKIITWKTSNTNLKDKVSASEWQKYRKHLTRISESLSKKEIEAKLKSIQEIIKKNQGFE